MNKINKNKIKCKVYLTDCVKLSIHGMYWKKYLSIAFKFKSVGLHKNLCQWGHMNESLEAFKTCM